MDSSGADNSGWFSGIFKVTWLNLVLKADVSNQRSDGESAVYSTLCLKKTSPFYICYNLIRCHPILSILGRNILHEIWNKHKCTENHISFRMFVL